MDELRISTHNSSALTGKSHLSIQPRRSPSYHRFSHLRSGQHHPQGPPLSPVEMSYQSPRFLDENKSQNNTYSATSPPCLECVSDCSEPSCSADEITPQCTDQCVVIACTDPTHSEMACHDSENSHCGLVCDGSLGCTDCTGFDEFVSPLASSSTHSSSPIPRSYDVVRIITRISPSPGTTLLNLQLHPGTLHTIHYSAHVPSQNSNQPRTS